MSSEFRRRQAVNAVIKPPRGYTYLPAIKTTGTQYINTGYIPKSNTKIVAWFYVSSSTPPTSYAALFGSRLGNYKYNAFCLFTRFNGSWVYTYNRSGVETKTSIPSMRNTADTYVVQHKVVAYMSTIDSYRCGVPEYHMTASTTGTIDDCVNPLFIFNINTSSDAGGATPDTSYFVGGLYRFQIIEVEDGVDKYIHDYFPARKTGVGNGLYDIMTGEFLTNAGTGTFGAMTSLGTRLSNNATYGDAWANSIADGYSDMYLNNQLIPALSGAVCGSYNARPLWNLADQLLPVGSYSKIAYPVVKSSTNINNKVWIPSSRSTETRQVVINNFTKNNLARTWIVAVNNPHGTTWTNPRSVRLVFDGIDCGTNGLLLEDAAEKGYIENMVPTNGYSSNGNMVRTFGPYSGNSVGAINSSGLYSGYEAGNFGILFKTKTGYKLTTIYLNLLYSLSSETTFNQLTADDGAVLYSWYTDEYNITPKQI